MYPINSISGIEEQEQLLHGNHVIVLLFVKPSDCDAEHYLKNINYWHHLPGNYCSIYMVGYSRDFMQKYPDIITVGGANNEKWEYNDKCFIEACEELAKRIRTWKYSGEPEMLVMQNTAEESNGKVLDFSDYCCININYGIKHNYIDSIDCFMQQLMNSCQEETVSSKAIMSANTQRISIHRIIEFTINSCPHLPDSVKDIINNVIFLKFSHRKSK